MIAVRKSEERGKTKVHWLDSRHSFSFADYWDPENISFRSLRVINEDFIGKGAGFGMHPHRNMEIVTYVLEGELAHEDSLGTKSILHAGYIQRMTAGKGIMHSEYNNSATNILHLLQIWITPSREGLTPGYEESKLDDIVGAPSLKLIASPTPPKGVLTIHQDAEVYSSRLTQNEKIEFEIGQNKGFWMQMISGEVTVNGTSAKKGDAVYGEEETKLEIAAKEEAHMLLFHL